jgi:multidrug efflux pump subunit AcrB
MKLFRELLIYFCSFILTVGILTKLAFQEKKDPSISQIVSSVYSKLDKSTVEKSGADELKKLYNISPSEVEDYVLFAPKSNMDANEFLVLRESSSNKTDQLINKLNTHLKAQQDTFVDYAPKQYSIVKNGSVEEIGKYIILVSAPNAKEIEAAYNKKF